MSINIDRMMLLCMDQILGGFGIVKMVKTLINTKISFTLFAINVTIRAYFFTKCLNCYFTGLILYTTAMEFSPDNW